MNNQTGGEDLRKPLAHVLVVDDDEGIRRNFRSGLEDLGYAVVVAADGREGLGAFAGRCFDIVMVDLWMPVMNGMEFIAELKKQSPLTPVVVVSGSGTLHDALQAIHQGAWDYVVKPVEEVEELDLVLRRNLDRARLLAENQRHKEQLEELVVERTHALQESEERLRALSDNLPDSLVYQIVREQDGTMRFLHISAGVERLNGLSAETVLRDPSSLYSQIAEEDRTMVATAEQDSLNTMSVFKVVVRMHRADGQVRWMHLCSAPRRLPDGRVLWDGIQTDITDRHQAEIALKHSEERFSRIFKTSPMPITLVRLADGRFIDANEGFLRMSGFTREEVVGHTSLELGLYQDAGQRQILVEQLRKHGRLHGHEMILQTKSGETRDIVIWADLTSIHGEVCRLSIAMDVTERKRAEDALRFSEERFRSAMQHSPIGMALIAPDGCWVEVNPALCAILGYTRDELRGTPFQAITHPDDLEADELAVRQLLDKQMETYQAEKRYIRKDRRPVWVQLNVSLVWNEAGDVRYFVCQIQDITERRRVEQALAASEGLLRQFIKHAPAAIAMLDTEMRYLQASDRWLTDYHLEGREIIGKSHYEVFPDIPERWKEVHRRVLAGAVERCDEDPLPRADGGTEWLQWEIRPWLKAEGSIGGLIMFTQVITERKEMEEAVRLSEDRFRSAMQHSAIGMALVSLDGRWLEVNPALCRIVGYSREEMLARDFQSITHPDDLEVNLEHARQMLAGEIETYEIEKRYVHKDGHVVWGQLNVSLLTDADGEPRHFVSQIQDISGRKQAEEARKSLEIQLRQAQKMESLGTLAGGIAHDFNNILGAILGNVELARSDVGADPGVQESLAAIGKAAHRARDLVRQILAFSRQQAPELRPVKLATVVDEAVRLLRATLPAALEIRTYLETQCPEIQADPTQLHQIIMNLGINSWHAMVDGAGTIDISVKNLEVDVALSATHPDLKPGPYLCLSVADNGKGMDEATLGRIFDPFFTTKAPGEGTGLGLAVAHGIMKNHHGAIHAESQPSKGTKLFLYFPTASSNVEAAEAVDAVEAPPTNVSVGEGQHILYVDDEAPLVRLVAILLERSGYRVSGFTNADEALAAFRAQPGQFSLLITDLNMPGMSGFEVASEVHRLRPELRTVVVSGYVTEELLKEAHACGVSEIIQKPYTFQDMGESIQRLLSKSN